MAEGKDNIIPFPGKREAINTEGRKVEIQKRVDKFISSNEDYAKLADPYKKIASGVAVNTLMLDNDKILQRIDELDALRYQNHHFARVENATHGDLHDKFDKLVSLLEKGGRYSFEEASAFADETIRPELARKETRIRLAEAFGYKPGMYEDIVTRKEFITASKLVEEVVQELTFEK
jgi:hypothetical protein